MADLQTLVQVIAKAKNHHDLCAWCHKPVKPNSDRVRACRWTNSTVWHWRCFLQLMAEQNQPTVRDLCFSYENKNSNA